MASIMKNFGQHEQHIFNSSLSLTNMDTISKLGCFQPSDVSIMDGLVNFLHGIHVDYELDLTIPPIIYDVANSCITELRGKWNEISLDYEQLNCILLHVLPLVNPGSALSNIHDEYLLYTITYPRRFVKDFVGFLKSILDDKLYCTQLLETLKASLNDDELYEEQRLSLDELRELCEPPWKLT